MAKIAVAPLVGAWIEIAVSLVIIIPLVVAPLVGAWIEIDELDVTMEVIWSLPSWERGLKSGISPIILIFVGRSPRGSVD